MLFSSDILVVHSSFGLHFDKEKINNNSVTKQIPQTFNRKPHKSIQKKKKMYSRIHKSYYYSLFHSICLFVLSGRHAVAFSCCVWISIYCDFFDRINESIYMHLLYETQFSLDTDSWPKINNEILVFSASCYANQRTQTKRNRIKKNHTNKFKRSFKEATVENAFQTRYKFKFYYEHDICFCREKKSSLRNSSSLMIKKNLKIPTRHEFFSWQHLNKVIFLCVPYHKRNSHSVEYTFALTKSIYLHFVWNFIDIREKTKLKRKKTILVNKYIEDVTIRHLLTASVVLMIFIE